MKSQTTAQRTGEAATTDGPLPSHTAVVPQAHPLTPQHHNGIGHDFTRVTVHSPAEDSQGVSKGPQTVQPGATGTTELLARAASDRSAPLEPALRQQFERFLDHDLNNVRVYQGAAVDRAAEHLGARAYTLGNSIHLGSEASSLSPSARARLLAHEAVHTIQQGGRPAPVRPDLQVSHPNDPAEVEAQQLAQGITSSGGSRALALRDRFRTSSMAAQTISRSAEPLIQRDLTGKYPTNGGDFTLNLKTESHPGAKNGMSGTIKFMANEKAPDSKNIRLLQVARDEDLTTGKEYVWTGDEANRNKIMTTADKSRGIEGGSFVDVIHKNRTPRTGKGDAPVSPYYIDDYKAFGDPNNKDGSKSGKTIKEASLWDYPGSSGNRRFSFETVAKAADTGHVYGTVMWGFTISDASKGTIEHERAVGRNVTLLTTDKAIEKFNEFYKNPGSSTAPK